MVTCYKENLDKCRAPRNIVSRLCGGCLYVGRRRMLETVLTQRNVSLKIKVSVKAAVSVFMIVLAVILPQLVHMAAGAAGGMKWLPMYLPVLIGGCVLGWKWGLGVGILSPIFSFAVTSWAGEPMPAAARLPFMVAELAVFAVVSGLFSRKMLENKWLAFPAVLLAQVAGRTVLIALVAVFEGVSPFTVQTIWAQIQGGLIGLVAQAVIVPLMVMGLICLLNKEGKHE